MADSEQPASGGRPNGYRKVPVREARAIPLPDGNTGEGIALCTDRGEIPAVLHSAPDSRKGSHLGLRRPEVDSAAPGRACTPNSQKNLPSRA